MVWQLKLVKCFGFKPGILANYDISIRVGLIYKYINTVKHKTPKNSQIYYFLPWPQQPYEVMSKQMKQSSLSKKCLSYKEATMMDEWTPRSLPPLALPGIFGDLGVVSSWQAKTSWPDG